MLTTRALDALREGIAPVWSHSTPRIDNCVFCQNIFVAWYVMPGHGHDDDDGAAFPLCAACAAQCGAEGAE